MAQPGAAVNAPQAVVVSSNPADWTPHVLDGKVAAIVQVGNKMVAGGQFTQVAGAAAPTAAIARSNIFAFDATTGAIDPRSRRSSTARSSRWPWPPTACTCSPAAASPVASGATDGRNWSTVTGMTMASGRLLYATTTGTLSTVAFSGGLPTGTATVVSGPAIDGQTWQSRGLLVLNLPT